MGVGNSFVSFLFSLSPRFFSLYSHSFSRTRVYTIIVCTNCLHSFTDGGEGLKIRGIGVKAKVKGKSEDIEVKSKGRKGNQAVARCFFCGW